MVVKIRLVRIGKRKSPKYRIVVMDSKKSQHSMYLEKVGFYDPFDKNKLKIDQIRVKYWIDRGAQYSKGLTQLIKGKN